MKGIEFVGSSLRVVKDFPPQAKRDAGYQLDRVQHGLEPTDWKPIAAIGKGVKEIRIQDRGQFRVIYVATFEDAVYVLHAFQKKSQRTASQDIAIAKLALKKVLQRHRHE